MCSSRGQCPLNCYCPMLPLQCLGEYQRHFLIRPPDIVQWHHYHRLRHSYFFQWLCFHWCYMYFSRLPHYFHGQITAALISRKTQHCASFDFALSFKILHCSDIKAIAHFKFLDDVSTQILLLTSLSHWQIWRNPLDDVNCSGHMPRLFPFS